MAAKKETRPGILGQRGEEILKAMRFYRYMTALDVCYLMYSPSSLNRVRSLLSELSGGGDFIGNQYLYRFRLPDVEMGRYRVYTLGSRGRDFLETELGISSAWYFRPEKVRHLSFGYIMHSLVLTRFLVAAHRWAGESNGQFKIAEMRICYDLAGTPGNVSVGEGNKKEMLPVVPDAWMVIEKKSKEGRGSFPVLLEIDRGTMYRQRFKKHVSARVEFVRSGGYEKLFGTKGVTIVYATAGEKAEEGEGRRRAIALWTMEALAEMRLLRWADLFRFCSVSYGELYKEKPFGRRVWYRPGEGEADALFEG